MAKSIASKYAKKGIKALSGAAKATKKVASKAGKYAKKAVHTIAKKVSKIKFEDGGYTQEFKDAILADTKEINNLKLKRAKLTKSSDAYKSIQRLIKAKEDVLKQKRGKYTGQEEKEAETGRIGKVVAAVYSYIPSVSLGIDHVGKTVMFYSKNYDNKGTYKGESEVLSDDKTAYYLGAFNYTLDNLKILEAEEPAYNPENRNKIRKQIAEFADREVFKEEGEGIANIKYNSYWGKWQVSVDGTIFGEFDTMKEAKQYAKDGGYKIGYAEGGETDGKDKQKGGMTFNIYRSDFKDSYSFYKGKDRVIVVDKRLPEIFEVQEGETPVIIKTKDVFGDPYTYAEPDKKGSWAASGSFIWTSDSRGRNIAKYPIPLHDRDMSMEKGTYADGGLTNEHEDELYKKRKSKIPKVSSEAKEKIFDIVYTKFENGGIKEKEERLKRTFQYYKIPYSRENVKDIIYSGYKARGGWRPYSYFTDWIFDDNARTYEGGGSTELKVVPHLTSNQIIAGEIISQLGGKGRLVAMTGAYDIYAIDNGVSFKIKNAKANYIKIVLNSMDLYDIEIGRIRGGDYKIVYESSGLYNDMLKPVIEKETGMYLSLEKGGDVDGISSAKANAMHESEYDDSILAEAKEYAGENWDKLNSQERQQVIDEIVMDRWRYIGGASFEKGGQAKKDVIREIYDNEDGVLHEIIGDKKQIRYHESHIAPKLSKMEKWEAKEYSDVHDSSVKNYKHLREYMMSNEAVFNEKLAKYNMSVSVFLSKLENELGSKKYASGGMLQSQWDKFGFDRDGDTGFSERFKGATAKNGDIATGEIIFDNGKDAVGEFVYTDKDGKTYQSAEMPAHRIDMSGAAHYDRKGFAAGGLIVKSDDYNEDGTLKESKLKEIATIIVGHYPPTEIAEHFGENLAKLKDFHLENLRNAYIKEQVKEYEKNENRIKKMVHSVYAPKDEQEIMAQVDYSEFDEYEEGAPYSEIKKAYINYLVRTESRPYVMLAKQWSREKYADGGEVSATPLTLEEFSKKTTDEVRGHHPNYLPMSKQVLKMMYNDYIRDFGTINESTVNELVGKTIVMYGEGQPDSPTYYPIIKARLSPKQYSHRDLFLTISNREDVAEEVIADNKIEKFLKGEEVVLGGKKKYSISLVDNSKFVDITDDLKNFDINELDDFERMQYDKFIKSMPKEEAIQVLINNVEGDYSQLSEGLATLAEKQDGENGRGYAEGGETPAFKNIPYTMAEIEQRLRSAKDFAPHKVGYYEELLKEAKERQDKLSEMSATPSKIEASVKDAIGIIKDIKKQNKFDEETVAGVSRMCAMELANKLTKKFAEPKRVTEYQKLFPILVAEITPKVMAHFDSYEKGGELDAPYENWKSAVIKLIEQKQKVNRTEAEDILDNNRYELKDSWNKKLSAEEAANIINEQVMSFEKGANVGGFDYKTVNTRTAAGLKEAEQLKKDGWKIISSGTETIQFEKPKNKKMASGGEVLAKEEFKGYKDMSVYITLEKKKGDTVEFFYPVYSEYHGEDGKIQRSQVAQGWTEQEGRDAFKEEVAKYTNKFRKGGHITGYNIELQDTQDGIDVINLAEEGRKNGDFKKIAHINEQGEVTYYSKALPEHVRYNIEEEAKMVKQYGLQGVEYAKGGVTSKPNFNFNKFFDEFKRDAYISEPMKTVLGDKIVQVEAKDADVVNKMIIFLNDKKINYSQGSVNKKKLIIRYKDAPKMESGGDVDSDNTFDYQMLGRLQFDCDAFLGDGNRGGDEKKLWAGSVDGQIAEMKKIWDKLKVKPEWLSISDIWEYERKMKMRLDADTDTEYASGGSIPNVYEGKTAEEVWDEWTVAQREHFLRDHNEDMGFTSYVKYDAISRMSWGELYRNDWIKVMTAVKLHVKEGSYEKGGALYTSHKEPLKYLDAMGAKVHSNLPHTTKNGIDFYIGYKGDKAIVVAFIEDENNYELTKEDAREMAESAKTKGVETVEFYTNYGVEMHSRHEKPSDLGFDKIHKVQHEFANGGKTGTLNIDKVWAEYQDNQDRNDHSENVVLLAKNFGSEEDYNKAIEIRDRTDKSQHGISPEDYTEQYAISKKLYPRLLAMHKYATGKSYADGGEAEGKSIIKKRLVGNCERTIDSKISEHLKFRVYPYNKGEGYVVSSQFASYPPNYVEFIFPSFGAAVLDAEERAAHFTKFEKGGSVHSGKFEKVMREFKDGTLTDMWGNKVTKRGQALAIAYSEARHAGEKMEKGGSLEDSTKHAENIIGDSLTNSSSERKNAENKRQKLLDAGFKEIDLEGKEYEDQVAIMQSEIDRGFLPIVYHKDGTLITANRRNLALSKNMPFTVLIRPDKMAEGGEAKGGLQQAIKEVEDRIKKTSLRDRGDAEDIESDSYKNRSKKMVLEARRIGLDVGGDKYAGTFSVWEKNDSHKYGDYLVKDVDLQDAEKIVEAYKKENKFENGGETKRLSQEEIEQKAAAISKAVEIATIAYNGGVRASDMPFEEYSRKVTDLTKKPSKKKGMVDMTVYPISDMRLAYAAMKGANYAVGGEIGDLKDFCSILEKYKAALLKSAENSKKEADKTAYREEADLIDIEIEELQEKIREGKEGEPVMAEGGETTEQAEVTVAGYPYYLTKSDISHLFVSIEKGKKGAPWSVDQYRSFDDDTFYKDIKEWLRGKLDINGRSYKKFYKDGGAIGFSGLEKKVAKDYAGKPVAKKYQKEYGKTYSKAESKEVAAKVAGKVKRQKSVAAKYAKK